MARNFDGVDDEVRNNIGNSDVTAAMTMAAVIKKNTNPLSFMTVVCTQDNLLTGWGYRMFIWEDSGADANKLGMNEALSTFTVLAADNWVLIAADKPAGNTTVRFHKYIYDTNVWTHANGGTSPDAASQGSNGFVGIGQVIGLEDFDGKVMVCGIWDRQLSDTEIEQLPFSLQQWIGNNPKGLWILEQSLTSQKVVDHVDNANENTLLGTLIDTLGVPIFNYGLGAQ